MQTGVKHSTKNIIKFFITLAVVVTQLGSSVAWAYSNQPVSPIPANMNRMNPANPPYTATTNGASSSRHTIRHVIKKENSSTMNKVQMAAYFSEARTDNQHRIRITDQDTVGNPDKSNNFERCHAYTVGGNKTDFIRVTLEVDTTSGGNNPESPAKKLTYRIRSDRVCNSGTANNTRGNLSGASFFGYYEVPTGFVGTTQAGRDCATQPDAANPARCDENTRLYRVLITIEYNQNNSIAPQGEPGTFKNSSGKDVPGGHKQQVTFRVSLTNQQGSTNCGGTASAGCTRYLSIVQVDTAGARNYSTLGQFKALGNPWYTRQIFQFGLPCTVRHWDQRTVSLYDVDNGVDWGDSSRKVTFRLEKRVGTGPWTAMNLTRTTNPNDPDHGKFFISANTAYSGSTFTPNPGDTITSTVKFWMEPAANYRINVANVHARNLLGVGLPSETIFGDLNCDYDLTPVMSAVQGTVAPGGTVNGLSGSVSNSLTTPSYGDPQSAVVRFVVPAGAALTAASGFRDLSSSAGNDLAASAGCNVAKEAVPAMRSDSGYCRVFGAGGRTYPQGSTLVWSGSDSLAGLQLNGGDRVCYMTIVNLYRQQTNGFNWRYSTIRCSLVLIQPKVAIWGNDLRVGSGFSGMPNANARVDAIVARESASWVEYAITAPSSVTGIASQSGAVNGSSDGQPLWSKLTFANTATPPACPAAFGCFTGTNALGSIPNVRAAVDSMSYGGSTLNYNVGSFSASGIGSIIGGATDLGDFNRSVSITSSGTITIDRDIIYNSGVITDEGAIPQLILIGNNINIAAGVHRVDAWLIAAGTINTCDGVAVNQSNLRSNMCNEQLRINGPVMANQLALNRTYADASGGQAAETINLRGDAYVWASRAARQNGHWQTIYTTELPPRY